MWLLLSTLSGALSLVDEGCDDKRSSSRCPGDAIWRRGKPDAACCIIPTVAASTPASNSRS